MSYRKVVHNLIFLLFIYLSVIALVSCASLNRLWHGVDGKESETIEGIGMFKFYSGPPLPIEKIALLWIENNDWVQIDNIDGAEDYKLRTYSPDDFIVEFLPGHHIGRFHYDNKKGLRSSPIDVKFDLRAGHIYRLHSSFYEKLDMTTYRHNKLWSCKIEDITEQEELTKKCIEKDLVMRKQKYPNYSKNILVLEDKFRNNEKKWEPFINAQCYNTYFEDETYILDSLCEDCAVSAIKIPLRDIKRYSIELKSIWKSGENNKRYGILIWVDKENYIYFYITGDGSAYAYGTSHDWLLPDWKDKFFRKNVAIIGDGITPNHQIIEVTGDSFRYYVNNNYIGHLITYNKSKETIIGVAVCGRQKVAFDQLKINVL